MDQAKPFSIAKREVWEAFKRVKPTRERLEWTTVDCGVRGQPFSEPLQLWNRLSSVELLSSRRCVASSISESEWRPAVGHRRLPDRIAQEVVRRALEPILEPCSPLYGYRPAKSAIDAVRKPASAAALGLGARSRHQGLLRQHQTGAGAQGVRHHRSDGLGVLLYIERWLKAPVQMEDGSIVARTTGTPQGG